MSMIVAMHQADQRIMLSIVQCSCQCTCIMYQFSPGIATHCLSYHFNMTIHEYGMFTRDEVMQFPCLATQERQATHNGPEDPFHYTCFILLMSRMHRQHHGHGTDDQNKCHHTHKG